MITIETPSGPGEGQMDLFSQYSSDPCRQQTMLIPPTITFTMPVNFIRDLHSELPDGDFREVIGHFYFLENLPPDVAVELRAKGYHPEQFLIHKSGD